MRNSSVIRFDPNGPDGAGLTKMQLESTDFKSELPDQFWHIYYADEVLGLTVGVWTTTSMQEVFGPYPGDEFMCILEGQVVLLDGKDNETVVNQGETFIVRNGIPVSWKQVGFCRKFFMTYLSPNGSAPQNDTADDGIKILREAELKTKLVVVKENQQITNNEEKPIQNDAICFRNETGNMSAGMWQSERFETTMSPLLFHELTQVLEGVIFITEAGGKVHKFTNGDVFFIPEGTVCSSKSSNLIRKFYCKLDTVK